LNVDKIVDLIDLIAKDRAAKENEYLFSLIRGIKPSADCETICLFVDERRI